jgi:hypothetical protein
MWSPIVLSTFLALLAPSLVVAAATPGHLIDGAAIVGRDTDLADCYDYVIVGGGASGLTVANRLSENRNGEIPFSTLLFSIKHLLLAALIDKSASYSPDYMFSFLISPLFS